MPTAKTQNIQMNWTSGQCNFGSEDMMSRYDERKFVVFFIPRRLTYFVHFIWWVFQYFQTICHWIGFNFNHCQIIELMFLTLFRFQRQFNAVFHSKYLWTFVRAISGILFAMDIRNDVIKLLDIFKNLWITGRTANSFIILTQSVRFQLRWVSSLLKKFYAQNWI